MPQLDDWQLIIATPWYDTKGRRTTYPALTDAFVKAGIYEDVPIRRIFAKSPNDPLVKALGQESSSEIEGTLHLLRGRGRGEKQQYSLVFAPFIGRGGSVPAKRFSELTDLQNFLVKELGVRYSSVLEALDELADSLSASIFPVRVKVRELRRLGLA